MRGRRYVVQIQLADPPDVVEDSGELAGHPLHLGLGKPQPGQLGDVKYLLPLDHGRDSRRGLSRGRADNPGCPASIVRQQCGERKQRPS